ncbi:MAG: cytochrome c oxidase subunit II [Deltaproteobacteria bacterium]|nr:cytochrome c oxidase subunit II [Deltaproteobacteria bacterium]
MSITSPDAHWFHKPTGAERVWLGLALTWCLVLTIMMPYWHFKGKQNSTGESYRVTKEDYITRVERFIATSKVGELNGVPVVEPAPGGDAYLLGQSWQWRPVIKLKKDQTYRLHISSGDYQHGFSLLPLNMNFQIMPGYDHVLTITPTSAGEFPVICNEYCGALHHAMVGRIIVE